MNQLQQIKLMNDSMIIYLKKIDENTEKNEIISKILDDEACFFKMKKEDAYIILKEVGISNDNLDSIYMQLISSDNYYHLKEIGKLDDKDEEIIVKYKNYDYNDIFKDRRTMNNTNKARDNIDTSIIKYKENIIQKLINKLKKILKIGI